MFKNFRSPNHQESTNFQKNECVLEFSDSYLFEFVEGNLVAAIFEGLLGDFQKIAEFQPVFVNFTPRHNMFKNLEKIVCFTDKNGLSHLD